MKNALNLHYIIVYYNNIIILPECFVGFLMKMRCALPAA